MSRWTADNRMNGAARKAKSRRKKALEGVCHDCPAPTKDGLARCEPCSAKNIHRKRFTRRYGIPSRLARELGLNPAPGSTHADR